MRFFEILLWSKSTHAKVIMVYFWVSGEVKRHRANFNVLDDKAICFVSILVDKHLFLTCLLGKWSDCLVHV